MSATEKPVTNTLVMPTLLRIRRAVLAYIVVASVTLGLMVLLIYGNRLSWTQRREECVPERIVSPHASALQSTKQEEPPPLGTDQENPELAAYIRRLITPPSVLPYNLTKPSKQHFSQFGQTQFLVERILPNMRDGFFLEAGAADGELYSNTLFLERNMGWRGLLIEPSPTNYQELLQKHRKAYSINAALSLTKETAEIKFRVHGEKGVLSSVWTKEGNNTITVRAIPLYAILKALDVTVIDYLSLDIEGVEIEVLDTVPWDKVKVRVMHVEYNHLGDRKNVLFDAMKARGMHFIGTRLIDAWFVCPELYKHTIQHIPQASG